MNTNNFFHKIISKDLNNIYVYLFFAIFLVSGLLIVQDYGLTTDEPFQRTIGYFWFIHLIESFHQTMN